MEAPFGRVMQNAWNSLNIGLLEEEQERALRCPLLGFEHLYHFFEYALIEASRGRVSHFEYYLGEIEELSAGNIGLALEDHYVKGAGSIGNPLPRLDFHPNAPLLREGDRVLVFMCIIDDRLDQRISTIASSHRNMA